MFRLLNTVVVLSGLMIVGALFPAFASEDSKTPLGTWLDHTGRGAIEIKECEGKLCGKVVWVKPGEPEEACGKAIIGNVQLVAANTWDNGWIYDPEFDAEFDVEITPLANGTLQVVGYAGIKAISETMVWTRAPEGLQTCTVGGVAAAE